jgi:arylsulfatase A-like enzyme
MSIVNKSLLANKNNRKTNVCSACVLGPFEVLNTAAVAGLSAGFLKAAFAVAKEIVQPSWLSDRLLTLVTPDVIWMAPLGELCLFVLIGAFYATLGALWRRLRSPRLCWAFFGFLGFYSVIVFLPRVIYKELPTYASLLLAAGLGTVLSRVVTIRRKRIHYEQRIALIGLIALLLTTLSIRIWMPRWSYQRALAMLPPPASGSPNVLVITLDTVRAQNLSLYGYSRKTSPHLERIASGGVVFDNAWSTSPWTLPSHATMFTGHYPQSLSTNFATPLDGTHPTLAEILRHHGYETAGFVGNFEYCGRTTGLSRGFVYYDDYPRSLAHMVYLCDLALRTIAMTPIGLAWERTGAFRKSAASVNRSFLEWADRRPQKDRPFFAFLNYYDAHSSYVVPRPFNADFTTVSQSEEDELLVDIASGIDTRSGSRQMRLFQRGYDDCVTFLDAQLGVFFDELMRRGLLQHTLVVITSDHGEQFGEHDLAYHGNSLYRQVLHVPLIFVWPGTIPSNVRISQPVSLRSLAATILDLTGVVKTSFVPGKSLASTWNQSNGEGSASSDPILSEAQQSEDNQRDDRGPTNDGPMRSIVADGYHLIVNLGNDRIELFNADDDPEESRDLAHLQESAPIIEKLSATLQQAFPGR